MTVEPVKLTMATSLCLPMGSPTSAPLERASILQTANADIEEFLAGFMERSKLDPSRVQTMVVGPSVGPHLGPGCVGGVVLLKH